MKEDYLVYFAGASALGLVGYVFYMRSKPQSKTTYQTESQKTISKEISDKTSQNTTDVVKTTVDIVKQQSQTVPSINLSNTMGVQQALIAIGYPVIPDGNYSENTKQAVRAFQAANYLKVDAIIGKDTRNALAKALSQKGIPYINENSTVLIKGVPKNPYRYSMYGWY